MQIPLEITFRDMPHLAAVEAEIREKAAGLEHLFGKLTSCRVVVETPVKLNKRQKELLEEFHDTLSDTGTRHSPRPSNWFEGVKNFFDDMKI